MFQENALFPWSTVIENVNLGMVFQGVPRAEREARARKSLEAVGLTDFADHYPGQLSGGMRQRAALARALSLETGILLMDEPFGALDEQTRMVLGEDLSVLLSRTDKTIVFVTHSLGEAVFLADRVAVFSARPGTIKEIIAIDEPHPRKPAFVTSEKFTRLRNTLFALLHDEIRKAMADRQRRARRRRQGRRRRMSAPARRTGAAAARQPRRAGRLSCVVLLGLWYLGTTRWGVSPILLPNPVAVWHELVDVLRSGEFIARSAGHADRVRHRVCDLVDRRHHARLSRSAARTIRIRVFEPLFAGIYSVPIILFLPLYVLFFGLGPASKIALGATISFFPIVLNTIAGFGNVDRIFITAARSMGASDFQLFRYVLLPAALPVILTGLRIGFTVALLSILGSETIASLAGLGHRIVHLAEGMEMARMFAYIAFVVAIAAAPQHRGLDLEARAKRRWMAAHSTIPQRRYAAARSRGRRIKRWLLARPGWRGSASSSILFVVWEIAARCFVDTMFLSPPSRVFISS